MMRTARWVSLLLVLAALVLAPAGASAQGSTIPEGSGTALQEEAAEACPGRPWENPGCRLREGVRAGVGNVVGAGFDGVFDRLYEWVAAGASWLLRELVGLIDSSARPEVGASWFGTQYRLMTALAVVLVLPLLLVSTLAAVVRQDWRGLVKGYFVYLPAAMVGTALAVPLVHMGLGITDWMSSLFLDGMRGDIEDFAEGVAGTLSTAPAAAAVSSSGDVAPFLMFMAAAVIALGAFAVWVELVLRAAGIYVALFFLPLGFAALVWPSTRKWFGRLVKALAALILSKFVIVAVLALAAVALGNLGSGDGTAFGGVIAGSALMLMAAFSPLVLFRIADVAGDDMAAAVEGATQHRTSPVPTPAPQQSASRLYSRIMRDRTERDAGPGIGMAASPAAASGADAASTSGVAGAGGIATAVRAPRTAAAGAGERVADLSADAPPEGSEPAVTAVGRGVAHPSRSRTGARSVAPEAPRDSGRPVARQAPSHSEATPGRDREGSPHTPRMPPTDPPATTT